MKVKELKELLNNFDDDDLVIMSKDSEGNRFSPLSDIDELKYFPITTWYGEVKIRKLTPELIERGFSEEDIKEGGENAIVLYPVN